MVIAWILIAIVAVLLGAGIVGNFLWSCSLADKELDLEKQEASLEHREEHLKQEFLELSRRDDNYKL